MARLHALDRGDLVADRRRALEGEFRARAFHRRDEFAHDRFGLAVEEHLGVAHALGVRGFVDEADARRRAALDLVLQARPRTVAEVAVFAVADAKQLLDEFQTLAHRARARERAEIAAAFVARAAMEFQARKRLVRGRVLARARIRVTRARGRFRPGQMDIRITLVVAQDDVVARPQRLDELRLEQQRLCLRARDRRLHARDLRNHRRDARIHLRLEEIAADALFEIARLADVKQPALRIEHAVHARRACERAHEGLAVEWSVALAHPVIVVRASEKIQRFHRTQPRSSRIERADSVATATIENRRADSPQTSSIRHGAAPPVTPAFSSL
jgi:hypothetical protein